MKQVDQKKLWQEKWTKGLYLPPNSFAVRSFKLIKARNLKSVLDLGAGNGRDSIYFAAKGLNVTAVDWSSNALNQLLEKADQRGIKSIKTKVADTAKLSFSSNSFDVIYAHLSLHYFNDKTTRSIFKKLHSMLNKGGLLFVKCKSVDDAKYGVGKEINKDIYSEDGHLRHFFRKDYMSDMLSSFDVIKIRKTSSIFKDYKSSFIEAIAKK